MYCIDASVLVSAIRIHERDSKSCIALLEKILTEETIVYLPEIALVEIVSAMVRATGNATFARSIAKAFRSLSNYVFLPVDRELADFTTEIIMRTNLRSGDAMYVAVAAIYRVPLVTLDREQLERGALFVETRLP